MQFRKYMYIFKYTYSLYLYIKESILSLFLLLFFSPPKICSLIKYIITSLFLFIVGKLAQHLFVSNVSENYSQFLNFCLIKIVSYQKIPCLSINYRSSFSSRYFHLFQLSIDDIYQFTDTVFLPVIFYQ